ncbi:hypothetical protein AVEN_36586-1 [Araneus ventricosus]|uniref:Uncharacterized protein n=1 Tax=Araneus ventricosus TaxID=182803 RepID=A0A4Y2IUE3_ARAVE|nr:hypothetical protein AVEN_36586-1 [Araneus ventricosus]
MTVLAKTRRVLLFLQQSVDDSYRLLLIPTAKAFFVLWAFYLCLTLLGYHSTVELTLTHYFLSLIYSLRQLIWIVETGASSNPIASNNSSDPIARSSAQGDSNLSMDRYVPFTI